MSDRGQRSNIPIVGSVLALCTQTPGTRRATGAPGWRIELSRLARAGFARADLLDNWVPFADLTTGELDDLGSILDELDLTAECVGTSRRSLIDPDHGEANLNYSLRIVDAAARLGVRRVGLGFHPALVDAQRGSSQFWEHVGTRDDDRDENWALATERLRTVCDHAATAGIDVNIELYEDSLFATASDVARLMPAVDRSNFGVNPDLGNIIRSASPLREPWLDTLRGCLPHMTYWHLKNYTRASLASEGPFAIVPTSLGDGTVDYRLAVTEAWRAGYRGPFIVEHYGGDALWMQEQSAHYLRRLLDDVQWEQDGDDSHDHDPHNDDDDNDQEGTR